MKVVVHAVGTPRNPGLAAAIRDYESRISHYFEYECVEIKSERITASADPERVSEAESRRLLERVQDGLEIVAVDERGKAWSSEQLARHLEDQAVYGRPGTAFLIGGPVGHSALLREKADRVLSLSSFTLPHELARLVLVEQIYRAGTIIRGEPYHRSG